MAIANPEGSQPRSVIREFGIDSEQVAFVIRGWSLRRWWVRARF
jgi:hypothetical protein